ELDYDERVVPGDVSGSDWKTAYNYLRSIGDNQFNLPELTSSRPEKPPADSVSSGSSDVWDYVNSLFDAREASDKEARREAAEAIMAETEFIYVDTDDRLMSYNAETGVFEGGGEREVRRIIARELGRNFSTRDRDEILATIEDLTAVDVKDLNAANHAEKLRCVKNGVINIETRELLEHSPKYNFTRLIPATYDPDAEAPNVDRFLTEITSAEDEKKTLEEMVGATLHPSYVNSKFLFLFGEGKNGKGQYFTLVREFLGHDSVAGRGLHELGNDRFAKADLHGKLANIGGDIDDRKLKNVGELKRLTSGTDVVTAQRKFGQPFEFVNSATMFFAANSLPAIEDGKRSMARRVVPIRMKTEFVEDPDPENPNHKQARPEEELIAEMTTEEELSGLLNVALDGLDRLSKNGDVSLERAPMERLEYFKKHSDPVHRFASECVEKEPGSVVSKSDVYEFYKEFSEGIGEAVRYTSVFWRVFKQSFHVEESQPRGDDGRERVLLDTAFSEDALAEFGSEHLIRKYGEESKKEEDTATYRTIAAASDSNRAYESVKGTVASVVELGDSGGEKAVVTGETGAVDLVMWDSDGFLSGLEGEEVAVRNASVGEHEGKVQLQHVENVTDVSVDSASLREEGQSPVTADGGTATETETPEWAPALWGAVRSKDAGDGVDETELWTTLGDRDGFDVSLAQGIVDRAHEKAYLERTPNGLAATAKLERVATDKLNGGDGR
ncbi:phage/plasmid primase, P4 family, partial [Halogeometricum luteum]